MSVGKPWEIDLTIYDDEPELLAGLRRGERMACTCLLKRHAPRLYRLALHLMGDADEAEDVLQEAFISACAHIAEFEGRSGLGTWLHRIVRNTALGRLRAQARLAGKVTHDDVELAAVPDTSAVLEDQVLASELGAQLEQAILTLAASTRAAVVLRDIEGLSTADAAQELGISESALKVRLHRARQSLRAILADTGTGGTPAPGTGSGDGCEMPEAQMSRLLQDVCAARPR
ncbi:MAG: sigma-70 family RNA polymerase sigma factor [Thermomicrobiales bacterium]